MSKSLSESAAEILQASVAGAAKEPMQFGGANVQVIGGPTHDNPAGEENPGAKAASVVNKNADPKSMGDAKVVKTAAMQEEAEEVELTEEELDEYLASLSEEELAALAEELEADEDFEEITEEELDEEMYNVRNSKTGQIVGIHSSDRGFVPSRPGFEAHPTNIPAGHEIDRSAKINYKPRESSASVKMNYKSRMEETEQDLDEVPELTEEEIAEARKAAMKEMVAKNMGSCKEDIDALFNGESLSEEFRGKAITIFEAAVRARVETVCEQLFAENDEILADTVASIEEDLTNNVDEYLNYVVEHWMSENELAIESGLRTEIAEEFMEGLKNLFTECYMEVPEEKADLVEEMAERVVEAEETLVLALEELEAATKVINEAKAKEILALTCEGLTKVQVEKIRALAEGVEFTTEGDYRHKLAVIRENYFPTNKPVKSEVQNVFETVENGQEVSGVMDYYVNAISKTLPK